MRRSRLRSALDDLRRLTWYLQPFRQALERSTSLTARSRVAVDEVLTDLPVTEFLTAETGKACPRSGRWIMCGADRTVEVEAGDPMPGPPTSPTTRPNGRGGTPRPRYPPRPLPRRP